MFCFKIFFKILTNISKSLLILLLLKAMKLTCKYSTTISNGRPSKPIQAQIGFCRRDDALLMKIGSKVKNEKITITSTNIKKIHSKFKHKGQATIEFQNPNYTVMLSAANPTELDKALRLIAIAVRGGKTENIEAELLSSTLPTLKQKDLKLKETITDPEKYPKTFSTSLTELSINTYRLTSVDIKWFALKHLTKLDLSDNRLGRMDEFNWKKFNKISKLTSLAELVLSNNGITELPWEFVHSLPRGLECLILSDNRLTWLPDEISDLRNLKMFSAERNPLEDLPEDFLYNCNDLQCLNVAGTKIETHSSFLRNHRFRFFSSSAIGKDFVAQPPQPERNIGTLFGLAASKIYDCRDIYYWLPFNVRYRMRWELFRCDQCSKLNPIESKRTIMIQPLLTSIIAAEALAPQGSRMQVNLINSTCRTCWNRDHGLFGS